jgi:hypothetical protein
MGTRLYVSKLPLSATEEKLRIAFANSAASFPLRSKGSCAPADGARSWRWKRARTPTGRSRR